jgi:hypothetical protein
VGISARRSTLMNTCFDELLPTVSRSGEELVDRLDRGTELPDESG